MIALAIIIGSYLLGAALHARGCVWYFAKRWPRLGWDGSDTAFCLYTSALWPISAFILAFLIYRLNNPAKPSKGLFARWFEKDRQP